jgi:hypothetical protein
MQGSTSENEQFGKEIIRLPSDSNQVPSTTAPFSNVSSSIDCNLARLSDLVPSIEKKDISEFFFGLKKRGVKTRIITKITGENVDLCRLIMPHCNLYHLDGIIGTFYIVDAERYYCDLGDSSKQELSHTPVYYYSNSVQFVRIQQFLFENLLNHAVPAKEKLKEIEKGGESEYIETIREPLQMLQWLGQKIKSSSFEILVLFSTMNSFYRAESKGILSMLNEVAGHGLNVRILIKIESVMRKEELKNDINQKYGKINVNFLLQPLSSKITTFIIDQTFSFTVETNDDSKMSFSDATGLATCSNSESTVFTYYSMFENLWIQAEIERQNLVKQAYFKMFKGLKLKDEVYKRDWSLKDKGEDDKQ